METVERARSWIGYLEKQSPELLGIYRANAGKGGCTVFAEIVYQAQGRRMQGAPWCATFLHAVYSRPDLLGKAHPGTRVLLRRMKRKGMFRGPEYVPEPGDIVFLMNHPERNRVDHCGMIEAAVGDRRYSIEGNAVDPSGTFSKEQGGAVARRARGKTDPMIAGYGAIGKYLD